MRSRVCLLGLIGVMLCGFLMPSAAMATSKQVQAEQEIADCEYNRDHAIDLACDVDGKLYVAGQRIASLQGQLVTLRNDLILAGNSGSEADAKVAIIEGHISSAQSYIANAEAKLVENGQLLTSGEAKLLLALDHYDLEQWSAALSDAVDANDDCLSAWYRAGSADTWANMAITQLDQADGKIADWLS